MLLLLAAPAFAQDPRAEQAQLADVIRVHPTDYETTYRYVLLSIELKDYEAAIGALERLLTFNPALSRAQKELGFLYARLGAYQTAAVHLRAALAVGDLDPVQTAQIETYLPDIDKQTLTSRWSGRLQVGLRSQSNASFFPANGLFLVGGVGVFAPLQRRADVNAFQLAEIANDIDLDPQGVNQFETRAKGYATEQFHLGQFSVGLLSLSAGPRFALDSELWRGASIKPYATGLTSMVGGINYLNAGGAGVSLRLPFGSEAAIEPGVEWRHLGVNSRGLFSTIATLATGEAVTASVAGIFTASDDVKLETRALFTRANAAVASQSFDQIDGQALLRVDVDPPFAWIGRKWTIAPFARIFQISFDAANPMVDPWRARRDVAWSAGVTLEAPVTAAFGFSGVVEYSRNGSNLPNFRTNNVSVLFGPVARF
ncbi:MAG: hypothetical protein HYS06_12115 [Methylocystis sp.]|nr:hypothetical protein [Methylocystis sp.]MBI3275364.1 hypothetical protein [Methylocystis sp.]